MTFYPVNLKINNKMCIVVGGGEVAARKVAPLLYCGARVKIISPEITSSINKMVESGQVDWCNRAYKSGDLEGAFLVFAATDNRSVQESISKEASKKGILINSVDDPDICSFQVPARVRRGDFLLTVSTGGGSPALAAKIRRELEEQFGAEYGLYIELLSRIRKRIVEDGDSSEEHKIVFEKLLQLNILGHIKNEDWSSMLHDLKMVLADSIDVELIMEQLGVVPLKTDLAD